MGLMKAMPFGKHKGMPFDELEDGYLEWLDGKDDLYGQLRAAVDAEVARRENGGHPPPSPSKPVHQSQPVYMTAEVLRGIVREELAIFIKQLRAGKEDEIPF